MNKGDKVKVYTDPCTRKDLEGEAVLLEPINKNKGFWRGHRMEYWKVRFEDGWTGPRLILNTDYHGEP
jgi:hypothetical protein